MLREPTTEKLRAMRLEAMAAAWNEQSGKPEIASLSFDERFGMLIDAEWTHRENKRLNTALREAKLKLSSACIEDLDYSPRRELDRSQLRQLATCRWVAEHQNVIVNGRDRHREDVPGLCPGAARVSQGLPGALSTSLAPLLRAGARTR